MPKREVLVFQNSESPWNDFLRDFFQDTASQVSFLTEAVLAKTFFNKTSPDLVFVDPEILSSSLIQAFEFARQADKKTLIFSTAPKPASCRFHFDETFEKFPEMFEFQKILMRKLLFPEKINVLVVDDEPEIGKMICDFLDRRVNPSFETFHADDGQKGFNRILEKTPDVLILDIKMPYMDGREVYREMRKKGIDVPTIVFFDSVFGNELAEMRRYGSPAVIEKGAPQSALPELMELVKKLSFFS